jgi:hypothetical protein
MKMNYVYKNGKIIGYEFKGKLIYLPSGIN